VQAVEVALASNKPLGVNAAILKITELSRIFGLAIPSCSLKRLFYRLFYGW